MYLHNSLLLRKAAPFPILPYGSGGSLAPEVLGVRKETASPHSEIIPIQSHDPASTSSLSFHPLPTTASYTTPACLLPELLPLQKGSNREERKSQPGRVAVKTLSLKSAEINSKPRLWENLGSETGVDLPDQIRVSPVFTYLSLPPSPTLQVSSSCPREGPQGNARKQRAVHSVRKGWSSEMGPECLAQECPRHGSRPTGENASFPIHFP